MNRGRIVVALALDVALWALAVWLLTAPPGDDLAPRAWHQIGTVCRRLALAFGRAGMVAERNYWKAVKA